MANEQKTASGVGVGLQNEATRKKATAARAVRKEKMDKLDADERQALKVINGAKSACDLLAQRVINKQPISSESLRACGILQAEIASVSFS